MRAIVTGAAGGIGRATAKTLTTDAIRRGGQARLLLVDMAEGTLNTVADEVRALGGLAEIHAADLTDPTACEAVVSHAEKAFGGLDVLASIAGIWPRKDLLEYSVEEWDRTFNVNTRATWLLAKAAFPMLKESKGCIVAVCSIAAHEPAPTLGAYSPSKAALMMMIRQLANDWGKYGIRSNSISPGSTANMSKLPPGSEAALLTRGNNPLGIVSVGEDQAAAIAFLVSPEARFINGADLAVDGGAQTQLMTASGMAASPEERARRAAALREAQS